MTEAEERLRDAVRLRHFSRHTEKPHVFWLKSKALSVRHSVLLRRSKGTLTPARFDAIVKEQGGRALTSAEKRQFRRFTKDPYP